MPPAEDPALSSLVRTAVGVARGGRDENDREQKPQGQHVQGVFAAAVHAKITLWRELGSCAACSPIFIFSTAGTCRCRYRYRYRYCSL